jgi:hypothetical protein
MGGVLMVAYADIFFFNSPKILRYIDCNIFDFYLQL